MVVTPLFLQLSRKHSLHRRFPPTYAERSCEKKRYKTSISLKIFDQSVCFCLNSTCGWSHLYRQKWHTPVAPTPKLPYVPLTLVVLLLGRAKILMSRLEPQPLYFTLRHSPSLRSLLGLLIHNCRKHCSENYL